MKAVGAGLAAATICVLLGNLAQVGMILSTWHKASDSQINTGLPVVDTLVKTADGALDLLSPAKTAPIYPGDWFWLSSRAINYRDGEVQPITEFPFFTFLYGDLHAHMIAMPLAMLALGWAIGVALSGARGSRGAGEQGIKPPRPVGEGWGDGLGCPFCRQGRSACRPW